MFTLINQLSVQHIDEINRVLGLTLSSQNVSKISGGDVNQVYKLSDGVNAYFLKLINEKEYAKRFKINHDGLIKHLNFSEHIVRQLKEKMDIISALAIDNNCVVRIKPYLITVTPWLNAVTIDAKKLGLSHITKAAQTLNLIHHFEFTYDRELAVEKFELFKNIGRYVLHHKLWKLIHLFTHKRYIFPDLHRVAHYISDKKNTLLESLERLDANTLCHNDLKPKNVMWGRAMQFYLVDWETVGLFNKEADHLDSLIAWCTVLNEENTIQIDMQRTQCFLKNYPLADPSTLSNSLDIVLIKSVYWLAFCLDSLIKSPFNLKQYQAHIKESIKLCLMLFEGSTVELIQSIQNNLDDE
ncbi:MULTISPECIES: phosphotransferase [unclassified Legionella]|uniref:phosphotransferase n=1 Tax=unclassified Legionella TaxID=2622702 RepID=UPI00105695A1|nr:MULTISPECIES: phosphotransferase [unclassified Legionella]MDI9818814.1 phosphotransferase [Legionella sp. PL877]